MWPECHVTCSVSRAPLRRASRGMPRTRGWVSRTREYTSMSGPDPWTGGRGCGGGGRDASVGRTGEWVGQTCGRLGRCVR